MRDDEGVSSGLEGMTAGATTLLAIATTAVLAVGAALATAGTPAAPPAVAAQSAAAERGYGPADRIGDLYLGAIVKLRLFVDSRTTAAHIDVDTHRRVVTLRGEVPGEAAKAAAEANAAVVRGVDVVRNRLEVVAPVRGPASGTSVEAPVARAAAPDEQPRG